MKIFTLSKKILKGLNSVKRLAVSCAFFSVVLLNAETLKAQQNGIFGSFLILNNNGGGNTFYDLLSVTANPDFQGANLGTFTISQTLVLAGAQNKTFKNNGGNITGGRLHFRIYLTSAGAPSFNAPVSMGFVSNDGGNGDQTWEVNNNTTNVLASLSAGTYFLEVYTDAPGFPTNPAFANNGGANYKATFTVAAILAPVANAVSAITTYGFTSGWNTVSGATAYKLDVNTIAESFTDNNFTSSPVWSGSTGSYTVLNATTLPNGSAATDGFYLASNSSVGNSALTTPSTENTEWLFSLGSPNFTPSTGNHFGVILMSTVAVSSIGDNFNGYFLRIGIDAVTDRLELWRSAGLTKTKIGEYTAGPSFEANAARDGVNLRVSRSSSGVFSVTYSVGFTYNTAPTISAGTLTDNTYNTSSFFGVYTNFASPAATRRVYLDNIYFGSSNYVSGYNDLNVVGTSQIVTLPTFGRYFYKVRSTNGSNTSANSNPIILNLANNSTALFRSRQTGNYNSLTTWEYDQAGDGVYVNAINSPATDNIVSIVLPHIVSLSANAIVSATGSVTVASGATFDATTRVLSGAGSFISNTGSNFTTANTNGINGSITTTTRTFAAGVNFTFNGSANQITGTALPASIATLSINTSGGSVVTLSNATLGISSSTNSLRLLNGVFRIGAANTVNISGSGTVAFTPGSLATTGTNGEDGGTVNFVGVGTVTGTAVFNNVNINLGVNFGTATTINGRLQINTGGFVNVNPVTYSSTSTLVYNALNVTYNRGLEWENRSGAGYPNNVMIQNGCTVNLANGSQKNRAIAGNLEIGTAASRGLLTMLAMDSNLTVRGNLVIGAIGGPATSELILSTAFGGDLNLLGNFTRNTNGLLTTNNRSISFVGTNSASISATSTQAFTFLNINKTLGSNLTLNTDIQVNNDLILASGQLITGSNKVILAAGATSGRTLGFVNGNFQKNFATGSNVTRTFEVGDGTNYTPVTLNFVSVSTAGDVIVRSISGQQPNIASSLFSATQNLANYYRASNNVSSPVSFTTYSASLSFQNPASLLNGATPLTFNAGLYGSSWTYPTINTRTSSATSLAGITSFGDFVLVNNAFMTQWNGTSWTNGSPNPSSNIILSANYTVGVNDGGVNLAVATLVVSSPNTLTVNADKTVTLTGSFENNGTTTLKSNITRTASFIDNGTISGSGVYNVEQYLTGTGGANPTGRVWFVSSPLTTASSAALNPALTQKLVFWNEPTFSYTSILNNSTQLVPMRGYQTRVGSTGVVNFTGGQFNTGPIVNSALSRTGVLNSQRGFHLMGNPYPSHLNWDLAPKVNLNSTIWYRTATSGNVNVFDTYNPASQLGTNNNGNGAVTGKIPPMQSFWIQVKSDGLTGSLTFNNSMREHVAKGIYRSTSSTSDFIRLKLSNPTLSDETIVFVNQGASNGFDNYDSPKLFSSDPLAPQFYTTAGNTSITINGINSTASIAQMDLGIKIGVAGQYEINATEINFGTQSITLQDKLLNVFQNLSFNPIYNFSSSVTNTSNRFTLIFDQPLPMSLLSFSGKKIKDANLINWKVATELFTKSYELQHLSGSEFVTIANFDMNTESGKSYSFSHTKHPEAINYYRLKSISINGEIDYSNVISINNEVENSNWNVYPSIANNEFTANYPTAISTSLITIVDRLGRKVKTVKPELNSNQLIISINELPNGVYSVNYYDGVNSMSKSLIKN